MERLPKKRRQSEKRRAKEGSRETRAGSRTGRRPGQEVRWRGALEGALRERWVSRPGQAAWRPRGASPRSV